MDEQKFYANVLQLIDVSVRRGAWEGTELALLAEIREEVVIKLKNWSNGIDVPESSKELSKENKNEKS